MRSLVLLALLVGPTNVTAGTYVGTIEFTEYLVAPYEAERLVDLSVKEGDRVVAGAVVARLDTALLEIERARVSALLAVAEARFAELDTGYRSEEISEARARAKAARARLEAATILHSDAERLARAEVGSASTAERARAEERAARRDLDAVNAALARLEAGPREERRRAAAAEVDAAGRAVDSVVHRIDRAVLRATVDGQVLDHYYELGEIVPAGRPIVKIGDWRRPYVDIYVAAVELAQLEVGDPLDVQVDGLPAERPLIGHVTELGSEAEFTPRAILTPHERARLVFRVRVTLDDPEGELRPGLPAVVNGP